MRDNEYNEPLTIGRIKDAIKDIPDNVFVNVLNSEGKSTANIEIWFEGLQTRKFVDLIGHKPYYEMTGEEKKKCGLDKY